MRRSFKDVKFETRVDLFGLPDRILGSLREKRPDLKVGVESTDFDVKENIVSQMWRQIGRALPLIGNTFLIAQERWSKILGDNPSRIIVAADSTGKDRVLVVGGITSSTLYAGRDCDQLIEAVVSEVSDIDSAPIKELGLID